MTPRQPRFPDLSALLGRGAWALLAVVMVLMLWQASARGAVNVSATGYSAVLLRGDPMPHPGVPVDHAMASAEAESEAGRSKPSGWKATTRSLLLQHRSRTTQVPDQALAFRARLPRRPLGQAPPRSA